MTAAIVGVDVGGTFTDLFWLDAAAGQFRTAKVPSNRGDEAVGFLAGLRQFGAVADLGAIVHGTTVGTNALLERKGARVGLITTQGFRDVLEMRRRDRRQTWGLTGDFRPVVDRDMRLEVAERTLADGTIRTPVDPDAVRAAANALLQAGAQSLAIVFVNSYANPANEFAALEAAAPSGPTPISAAPPKSCPRSESSNAPRPPASTPTYSPSSAPTSPSSTPRCAMTATPAPSTSCRVMAASCRPKPPLACRSAPRCPAPPPASSPPPPSPPPPAFPTSSPATSAAPRSTSRW